MLSAQNLHGRSNLSPGANVSPSDNGITADVDARSNPGFRMSKKRAKRNTARKGTLFERQPVERNSEIVPWQSRRQGKQISEEAIDWPEAPKSAEQRRRSGENEGGALYNRF